MQTFPNSNRGDLGHSEHDYIYSPWGLRPFSEILRSVSLTSVVTETKVDQQGWNNCLQIIPMCISLYPSINAQPFNWERKKDCELKTGLNATAGYAVAGFILAESSRLILVHYWMVLTVSGWAMKGWHHRRGPALNPRYNFLLQRKQNLW